MPCISLGEWQASETPGFLWDNVAAGGVLATNVFFNIAVLRLATLAAGCPAPEDVDGDWFKGMWLSNRDFLAYFDAAICAPPPPAGEAVVVNAMSNNKGMRWSLDETVAALGVVAQDDSRRDYSKSSTP